MELIIFYRFRPTGLTHFNFCEKLPGFVLSAN
jgi:hypothetical protein